MNSIFSHVRLISFSSINKQPHIILNSLKNTKELVERSNDTIHISSYLNVQYLLHIQRSL
jgi:hypothetical protein